MSVVFYQVMAALGGVTLLVSLAGVLAAAFRGLTDGLGHALPWTICFILGCGVMTFLHSLFVGAF